MHNDAAPHDGQANDAATNDTETKVAASHGVTVGKMCEVLERIAPIALAQEWDNVGLIAGDRRAAVKRALLCIDLTEPVVDEAVEQRAEMIVAYHPPIFRPIARLHGDSHGTDAHVFRCIAAGIAIYSLHTALDAAAGGTNDVLAGLCGVEKPQPMVQAEFGPPECKIVVFVPAENVEAVADAMFAAGAGRIGEYDQCSYRIAGEGTFRGSDATNPTIGQAGRFETVAELRVETVVPSGAVPEVVNAIRRVHPYEEPAFDVYELKPKPVSGIGRVGELPQPIALRSLADRLRSATNAPAVQMVGPQDAIIRRVIVCAGSAGSLPFRLSPAAGDAIVTGEMRHHDALTVQRQGCSAIMVGHWSSERPVLSAVARRIETEASGVYAPLSSRDCEPFAYG